MNEVHADLVAPRSMTDRRTFWAGLLTSVMAIVSFGIAVTTPPRSGPFAAPGTAIAYPYAAAAKFVPRDFIWMYPVMLMAFAYLFMCVCLYERASATTRTFATLGLVLATTSFAVLSLVYFIQVYTIQPALLAGEAEGVVALSQYNPHGVFIALENLGYLAMALSLGAFAPSLTGTRVERAGRVTFAGAAVLGLVALVVMSWVFGLDLEYRFEVAIITVDYFALALGGLLVALAAREGSATRARSGLAPQPPHPVADASRCDAG